MNGQGRFQHCFHPIRGVLMDLKQTERPPAPVAINGNTGEDVRQKQAHM